MRAHPLAGIVAGLAMVAVLVGCGATGGGAPTPQAGTSGGPTVAATVAPGSTGYVDVDGRPFRLHVPTGFSGKPVQLVVGLHGYTSRSAELDGYLGLTAASDERGFLLALPDGTLDNRGDQFWNAVRGGCCDFGGTGVDDSGYLSHLVTAVQARYPVDRVAVVGHSNGGYMAHRFACDHADQVDAIASLAGPLPDDTGLCAPSRPVTVLHVHGTADTTVPYTGRTHDSSATATAEAWARFDGCDPTPTSGPAQDDETTIPGAETTVERWAAGCKGGSGVQLWSIQGGGHVPSLSPGFTGRVLGVLLGG